GSALRARGLRGPWWCSFDITGRISAYQLGAREAPYPHAPRRPNPVARPSATLYAASMNTTELADKFVQMCKEGRNFEVMQQLYHDDIVSVEAVVRKTGRLDTAGKE